ncbi:hypothetical protein MED297_20492 [Reinekea sp. MED297]|uniref:Uncharacterized protein n=1 Tax=Reinekea blandensis MED297 TaxID=314283 RepID=A4B9K3_9GAMM|nr:hypothetical protein MED297_20492 [Reinekea sp. MED297] [Reinekea blandensis MED297]
MDVENMDVFVERIRTILAAIHLRATFLSAGFIKKLRRPKTPSSIFTGLT